MDEGKKILRESGLPIIAADDLDDGTCVVRVSVSGGCWCKAFGYGWDLTHSLNRRVHVFSCPLNSPLKPPRKRSQRFAHSASCTT